MRFRWLGVAAIVLVAFVARADAPGGMPPDIAKILDKIRSGQMPTPEEAQRFREWQQGLLKGSQFPVPNNAIVPDGIPVRVHVSERMTITQPGGSSTYTIEGTADALMYPKLNGTADYALDPAHGSLFAIQANGAMPTRVDGLAPGARIEQGGGLAPGGNGSAKLISTGDPGSSAEGALSDTSFGAMIVTTGKGDALFATGGFGGVIDGTETYNDAFGHHSRPLHGMDAYQAKFGTIAVPFAAEDRARATATSSATPAPTAKLSYRQLADAVRSTKTTTIATSETFTWKDGDALTNGQSSIEITIRPPKVELVIQPTREMDYEKWLPLPDASDGGDKKLFGDPKPLAIHLALHDTTSDGPAKGTALVHSNSAQSCDLELTIKTVSKNDGVAMNYPPPGKTDLKSDLFFPTKGQPANTTVTDEGQKLVVKNAKEADVLVAARDTGAYGTLTARCASLAANGRDPRTGRPELALPMDDNHNDIADAWEKDPANGVYGRNLDPMWDEEDQPSGMKTKGDGSSLFDQYRGFLAEDDKGNETLVRPSPKQKSLFIYLADHDRALHRRGADLFGKVSGIKIYYVHDPKRLADADGAPHPRVVGFRTTAHSLSHRRYAVWVDDDPNDPNPGSTGDVVTGISDEQHELLHKTPATTKQCNISHSEADKLVTTILGFFGTNDYKQAAAKTHLDLRAVAAWVAQHRQVVVARLVVFSTLHELGHAFGGRHHGVEAYFKQSFASQAAANAAGSEAYSGGKHDCPMRYWHYDDDKTDTLLWISGTWDPTANAPPFPGSPSAPWKFCTDEDWTGMSLVP